MKISIIVIAYNIEAYIERCLNSVLNQTFKDIEVIVVNDGSTDNTLEVIEHICKSCNNVTIINKNNQGSGQARKDGFKKAKGEYVLFIDGDDWLELDALDKLYLKVEEKKPDVLLYNAYWAYKNNRTLVNTYDNKKLLYEDPIKSLLINDIKPAIWAKFIKREYIIKNNIEFPIEITYGEDLVFVSNLLINRPSLDIIEYSLYNYYQRDGSITKSLNTNILEIDKAIGMVKANLEYKQNYDLYKSEFEYMVYLNLFIYKIIEENRLNKIHYQLYKQFKNRKINIYKNKYILKHLHNCNLKVRIRIELYNLNYFVGQFYDFVREKIKAI